jgi:hypothetical protein
MGWQQRSWILASLSDEQLARVKRELLALARDDEGIDLDLRFNRLRELGELLVEEGMRQAERSAVA